MALERVSSVRMASLSFDGKIYLDTTLVMGWNAAPGFFLAFSYTIRDWQREKGMTFSSISMIFSVSTHQNSRPRKDLTSGCGCWGIGACRQALKVLCSSAGDTLFRAGMGLSCYGGPSPRGQEGIAFRVPSWLCW
eukprot:Phypoly_transcript_17348.p1 GENE.Phypoly_transcript_17348~~Phypoly_transcript_17348.p1  ORF type:complete len:135 (+),score=1.10 Phypoly_transcript_17348:27-431(+)